MDLDEIAPVGVDERVGRAGLGGDGTSVDSTALRGEQIAQQLAAPASRRRHQVRPGAKSSRDHRHMHGLATRRFERL